PLRVIHVLFRLEAGGMEYGVIKVVNGVDRVRISNSICSTTPAEDVKTLLRRDVRLYECHRRAGNDPSLVLQLYRVFRRERPHIVHTHAWGTLCEGVLAARLARVPIVIHGEHGTLQLKPYQARVQRMMWRRADRVLSVSSRLAERMAEGTGFPLERITVIRNGVDLSRFQSCDRVEARRALGLPLDGVVVGTAARLVPVKDQANLLNAFKRLADEGVEFTGVVAGDGPLRPELQAQAEALGIRSRVRFLGHVPDVERVYAALDIFVLSSKSEGLSNTILEAMASRVAIVATRVGGADELVEDGANGVLVPPQDSAALADAIGWLARDADVRQSMAAEGRRRALTRFTLDRMIRNYASLYWALGRSHAVVDQRPGTQKVM
ncbi:MAG TPA: glycosyltransferase, partial [Vicinamibacterales bacterium]|nr:glycosyltransferase [Vicinamibacterales bacterium]